MTARDDMTAAGLRVLDLLTMSEAAALLPGPSARWRTCAGWPLRVS